MSSTGNKKRKCDSTESSPTSSSSMAFQGLSSSEASASKLNATTNKEDSTSDSESEPKEQVRRRPSPLTKSKHWKWYVPKDTLRLMHLVFANPDSLEEIAFNWGQLFEENEECGVMILIQFFVDVTGYTEYTVETSNVREIVDYMEANISDVIVKHSYIFKFDTSWYKQACAVIFDFIKELLKQHKWIYYEPNVSACLLNLFKAMSLGKLRAVKHAGVVFALKFAVNCSSCLKNVQRDLKKAQESYINSVENMDKIDRQMRDIAGKRDVLNEHLASLFAIISRNYALNDNHLVTMRVMCAADIYSLLRAQPKLFFDKLKCIPMLIILLKDQNKKVRASAVKTFVKLFETDKYKEYTNRFMKEILNALHDSMRDIDLNVAASAIDAITNILKVYPFGIPNETRRLIFCTVYHKTYVLGRAAGNFLVTFLRMHWGARGDETAVLAKFVQFQHTSEKLDLIPTIVDSVIEDMPELQSYEWIINILANNKLEFKDAVTLLDVLRHTVSQIVTGKSEQARKDSKRGAISKKQLKNIRYNLIPNLMVLFERYRERECREILVGILLPCFTTKIITASLRDNAKKIFKTLRADFFTCNDRNTLDMISRIYQQMSDDLNPLKSLATAEAECCILKVVKAFDHLMKKHHGSSMDLLEVTCLRLAILYQHFNLSERDFVWGMEFPEHIEHELDRFLPHHIESGCYMLVWGLRELLESDGSVSEICGDIEKINIFKIKCVEYLQFCFSYWDQSQDTQAKVFWCVCDLLQKFHRELKELVKLNPELKNLYFDLDSEQQECLLEFLKGRVLLTSVPDRFGCEYLAKFLNTVLLDQDTIPFETMTTVFGYYFSLYDKYQDLFDATLEILRKSPTKTLLESFVLKVMLEEYEKLENKQAFGTAEHFNLGKLAVRFSLYLSPCNRLFEVVYMALEYFVVHPENLSLLRYLRYFVDPLKQASRTKLLKIARVALVEHKRDEHVICFIKRIEEKYIPNRNVRPASESSDTSVNISTSESSDTSVNISASESESSN